MAPMSPLTVPALLTPSIRWGLQSGIFEVPCSPQILEEAAQEHMLPSSMLRPPAPPSLLERSALTLPQSERPQLGLVADRAPLVLDSERKPQGGRYQSHIPNTPLLTPTRGQT